MDVVVVDIASFLRLKEGVGNHYGTRSLEE